MSLCPLTISYHWSSYIAEQRISHELNQWHLCSLKYIITTRSLCWGWWPGSCLNIKTVWMVIGPSYLYSGNPYTGKTASSLIARLMGPTWGPPGATRTQVGPMLATWTLLSGFILKQSPGNDCTSIRDINGLMEPKTESLLNSHRIWAVVCL